jgi:hypothetical protein
MKMHKYKKVANKNQNACLMMKQNVKLLENMSSTFKFQITSSNIKAH